VTTSNGILAAPAATPFTVRTEGTGFGFVNNVSDLRQTLVASVAPGTAGTNALTTTNPQVNRTTFSVANLTNNFYWGSVNPTFTTLPVDLLSFTAASQSSDIVLNWQTATETDCSYFSLERSGDGVNYAAIATVPTEGGPDLSQQYAYTDYTPNPGENYYRLKMVSYSGVAAYSGIAMASIAEMGRLTLFPNPCDGNTLNVSIDGSPGSVYTVDIYNDQGKLVKHISSPNSTISLGFTSTLAAGVYIARVASTSGFTATTSFLVRR
jgi:hypothetical protein